MHIELDRGSFGPVLRRLRLAAKISQEELAERAHLSVESISALERGRRRAPYRETVRMLADALRLTETQRQELEAASKQNRVSGHSSATNNPPNSAGSVSSVAQPEFDENRHNLVRPLSSFHNRRRELDELASLLAQHRLVSITGAGGIGKTRVALEVAWNALKLHDNGVWFIDLAPLSDHSIVARSLISTLCIPERDGETELQTLIHHLKRRNALLVIDNCEHVVYDAALLVDALLPACPRLSVLATSREPLRVSGEYVYQLPSLELATQSNSLSAEQSLVSSAVALFVARAAAANAHFRFTDFTAPTVAEICRRLDGIPLAIELAASRSSALSPQQIVAQLEDHFRILAGGSRTVLPRQRTMWETIRWSYDRLDDAEQLLFRRVATFVNGFTWESVRSLTLKCSPNSPSALGVLASLVDKSLVVADVLATGTRYRVLAPMRAYGLETQEAAGEHEALKRIYAQWCLDYVQRAHEAWETLASPVWSAQVEPEIDNLRACLIWALRDRNDVVFGQRLIATSRRLWARISPSEGKRWLIAASELIDEHTPDDLVASLGLAEMQIYVALQQFTAALNAAQETEKVHDKLGDELAVAECQGFKGLALACVGRGVEGEPLIEASVTVYRARGARQLAAHGVNDLAIAHLIRGDLVAARKLLPEAMSMFRAIGNDRGVGGVAANLAEVEFAAGNVEGAVRLCGDALATADNGQVARRYLINMAAYLVQLARYDEARAAARESILGVGIARADIEVAFALQHLAAICAFRTKAGDPSRNDDLALAARLVGFVDSRLATFATIRQFTELSEYNGLVNVLCSTLSSATFDELQSHGRSWSEEIAVHEAMQI